MTDHLDDLMFGLDEQTPGTRMRWGNLEEWLEVLDVLEKRHDQHATRKTYQDLDAHFHYLRTALIDEEKRPPILARAIEACVRHRPVRGQRGDHPTTALLVAARNALARTVVAAKKAARGES